MRRSNFVETALELGAVEARLAGTIFGAVTFERQHDAAAFVELYTDGWNIDKIRQVGYRVIIKFWKFKQS